MEKEIELWNKLIHRDIWIRNKKEREVFLASFPSIHSIISALPIPYKYTGAYALIPINWDYEKHITEYPLTNYLFIKTPNGRIKSINRNGVVQNYFDKDRLMYIIGLISSIPAKNKDSITEDGFVKINSKLLRSFFKDYLSYLDYLLQTNVLITDGDYTPGIKSLGYKFAEQYNTPLTEYLYNNIPSQDIPAINSEIFDDDVNGFVENPVINYPYLYSWYSTKKLTIQKNEAIEFANNEKQRKISLGKESWDINRDLSSPNRVVYKNPTTQYNAAVHNIMALSLGQYNIQIDNNVHRLHSVVTNIQKSYRRYLKYDGNTLVGVDISNSQPYLLCLLFNPLFWERNSGLNISLWHLPHNIQQYFNDIRIARIVKYTSSLKSEDLITYKTKASEGLVYEYMMDIINGNYDYGLSRDDVKIMMMTVLFSDNRYLPYLKRLFKNNFPVIYELIRLIKQGNHKSLPCLLQNIESEIILHRCCKRIWEEYNQEIPIFTIHDSICTIPQCVEIVKSTMTDELEKAIGIKPHLKVEEW